MANQQELLGNWNEIKGKLRQRWGQLTEDDLRTFNGNVEELVGLIQRKTGESRDAIGKYVSQFSERGAAGVSQMAEQVRERVGETSAMVAEQFRDGYAQTETLVRERPGQSLAAAFGAGVIAGLVFGLLVNPRS